MPVTCRQSASDARSGSRRMPSTSICGRATSRPAELGLASDRSHPPEGGWLLLFGSLSEDHEVGGNDPLAMAVRNRADADPVWAAAEHHVPVVGGVHPEADQRAWGDVALGQRLTCVASVAATQQRGHRLMVERVV